MEQNRKRTKLITEYGILIALALICSYIESLMPAFFVIPGIKLGLTNVVVLIALYRMNEKSAMAINLIRIVLVAFLFGNMVSMIYSMAGGMLSTIVMIGLKRTKLFGMTVVSVTGGIAHNVGQIAAAAVLLGTNQIWWYLMILWFSGILAGVVIGLICAAVNRYLPQELFE